MIAVLAVVGAGIATAAVAWQGTRSTRHATTPGRGLAHTSSVGTGRATTTIPAPTTTTPTTQPPGPGFLAGRVERGRRLGDARLPGPAARRPSPASTSMLRSADSGPTASDSSSRSRRRGSWARRSSSASAPTVRSRDADFDAMMAILGGASRVVFVNVHVDRPWQDPNNAVLADGAEPLSQRRGGGLGRPGRAEPAMVRGGRHPPRHRRAGGRRAGAAGGDHAGQRMTECGRRRGRRIGGVASIFLRGRSASGAIAQSVRAQH